MSDLNVSAWRSCINNEIHVRGRGLVELHDRVRCCVHVMVRDVNRVRVMARDVERVHVMARDVHRVRHYGRYYDRVGPKQWQSMPKRRGRKPTNTKNKNKTPLTINEIG